jgi:hypothetical protein
VARQELKALQEEGRMMPNLGLPRPCLLDCLGLEDTCRERDFYLDLDGVFVDFTISEPAISPSISDIMVTSLLGMQTSSW